MSDVAVLLRVCRHISHVGWDAEKGFDVSSFRFISLQKNSYVCVNLKCLLIVVF